MRAFSINDLDKDLIVTAFTMRRFNAYLWQHRLCSKDQVRAVLKATPAASRTADASKPIGEILLRLLKEVGAPPHPELEAEMSAPATLEAGAP